MKGVGDVGRKGEGEGCHDSKRGVTTKKKIQLFN